MQHVQLPHKPCASHGGHPSLAAHLTIQIPRDCSPQLPATLSCDGDEVLQIVSRGQAHAADEILCGRLDVAVLASSLQTGGVVLGSAKVCV